jgi:hypothetical protein
VTYRIEVPTAVEGDVVLAVVHGAVLSVTRNGKVLAHAEYQLSCEHEHETAGCPACLARNAGFALRDGHDKLSRGVGVRSRGTWRMANGTSGQRAQRR